MKMERMMEHLLAKMDSNEDNMRAEIKTEKR
jgi:hypothetical protein